MAVDLLKQLDYNFDEIKKLIKVYIVNHFLYS